MSAYYDLLTGVQNSILVVPLVPPVSLRDDLFLLENETTPLVLVAPGPSNEKIKLQTFGKNVVYEYPVLVAYITPANRSLNSDLKKYLDIRQGIRDQLYQVKAPGLTETWDTDMEIGAVSKFAAVVGTNYRVTGWEMRYSVSEIRLGN